jgi:hypothetical protein
MGYIQVEGRNQGTLVPVVLDDFAPINHVCRDAFVEKLVMSSMASSAQRPLRRDDLAMSRAIVEAELMFREHSSARPRMFERGQHISCLVFRDSLWSFNGFLICLALCCQRHHHTAHLIRLWRKHQ